MKSFRALQMKLWEGAYKSNRDNILKLLEKDEHASLLDLGCGEGTWTLAVAERIGTKEIHGVEIAEDLIEKAVQKGLVVVKSDLNERFPFDDDSFDVVHANQVIEHVVTPDNFVEEIHRVLKPGGYVILSTENLSSFDNLLALFLGQQAFSQSISERKVLGNIFSPSYGVTVQERHLTHKTIFTYFGLQHLLKSYNFSLVRILTAGYGFLARLDPVHARFMVIKARKKVAL